MQSLKNDPKPIRICLEDSLFREKSQKYINFGVKQGQNSRTIKPIHKAPKQSKVTHSLSHLKLQPNPILSFQEYLNGQYHGFTVNKQPFGTGIFIDDQFNFFLSSWNHMKMNKPSFVKLLNGTLISGTWVHGKPNGWNCIKIGKFQIFVDVKSINKKSGETLAYNLSIVIDRESQVAYLLEINSQKKVGFKILNRKSLPRLTNPSLESLAFSVNVCFPQVNIKIPHYLQSLQNYFANLSENNPQVIFQTIESQKQNNRFVSVQKFDIKEEKKIKRKPFLPYRIQYFKDSNSQQSLSLGNQKSLGLIFNQKTTHTKSIGVFCGKRQLNGIGLTFAKNNALMFGHFKSNLLSREFSLSQPLTMQSLKSGKIKKQLTKNHVKSLNFTHDFIYFEEVQNFANLGKQIVEYVTAFETQYLIKFGKDVDSLQISEQSIEVKYEMAENLQLQKQRADFNQDFKRTCLDSIGQRGSYGKIVNSRSPLRVVKRSHSKSPSQIQTYRQRSPYPLQFHHSPHNLIQKSNRSPYSIRNLKISITSPSNMQQSNHQVTSKHKSHTNQSHYRGTNRVDHYGKRQFEKQQDEIAETVRRRNECQMNNYKKNNNTGYGSDYYNRNNSRAERQNQFFRK